MNFTTYHTVTNGTVNQGEEEMNKKHFIVTTVLVVFAWCLGGCTQPPKADFTVSQTTGMTPFQVQFANKSVAGSLPIVNLRWNFGDWANPKLNQYYSRLYDDCYYALYTYSTAGNYTVTLTANSGLGVFDSSTVRKENLIQVVDFAGTNVGTKLLSSGLTAYVVDEAVSFSQDGFNHLSMTLDSQSQPHLIFKGTAGKLIYVKKDGSEWLAKKIGMLLGHEGYGGYNAIAIDGSDKVHIVGSLSDYCDEDLFYLSNESGCWLPANANSGPSCGLCSDIAIGVAGETHAVHWSWNGRNVLYSTNRGHVAAGYWVSTTPNKTLTYSFPDIWILLDSLQAIHLIAGNDHYALQGEEWKVDRLSFYTKAACIDSYDTIYAAKNDGIMAGTDNVWQEVASYATAFPDLEAWLINTDKKAMTVDFDGNIHLCFVATPPSSSLNKSKRLYYATNLASQWQTQLIDEGGSYADCNIAIGLDGNIHLAYKDINVDRIRVHYTIF